MGYSNSDLAGDHTDIKSISGFIFMLNGGLISYILKEQAVVALLSIETKYATLSLATWKAT